jgi:hypothetical protein
MNIASFGLEILIHSAFVGLFASQKPKNAHLGMLNCAFLELCS